MKNKNLNKNIARLIIGMFLSLISLILMLLFVELEFGGFILLSLISMIYFLMLTGYYLGVLLE